MPTKPKKGKGKGKGKKKSKSVILKGHDTVDVVLRRFLKTYEKNCQFTDSRVSPGVKKTLKEFIEEEKLLVNFILEAVPVEKPDDFPVLLEPLLTTIRQEHYTYIKDLHVWDYPMTYETMASLALLLEKQTYPLRLLEIMDCLVTGSQVERMSRALPVCNAMTHLLLDYNEFGDEGCTNLCSGLKGNKTMVCVSMCYCEITAHSGKLLGEMVSSTAVRELFLDGNDLECEGAMELIKMCADQAEVEGFNRHEQEKQLKEDANIDMKSDGLTDMSETERAKSATSSKKKKVPTATLR